MSEEEGVSHVSVEWSHFVDANTIDTKPKDMDIHTPSVNFNALCRRLGLDEIKDIKARVTLKRNDVSKVIHVKGKITANVNQLCVVTSEPVEEYVEEEFEAWFSEPNEAVSFTKAKRERLKAKEREEQPILEEFDDPEQIIDGKIDLGELIIQNLSLALNPYPRCKDARANFGEPIEDAPEGTYNNPFAALKDWKAKEKEKNKD